LLHNPPLAVVMPLFKELPNDPYLSSEESLFSFPNEQQSLLRDSIKASNIIRATPPSTLPEIQKPFIEEFDESSNEPYFSLDSSSEEDDNDLFLSDSTSIGTTRLIYV